MISEQDFLWEIGDLLVYVTAPEAYDALPTNDWDFGVEPVSRLREYMCDKAVSSSVANLFVLVGTLNAIPLPTDTADVLLTCRAIGV